VSNIGGIVKWCKVYLESFEAVQLWKTDVIWTNQPYPTWLRKFDQLRCRCFLRRPVAISPPEQWGLLCQMGGERRYWWIQHIGGPVCPMLNLALKSWMRLRRFLNGSEVSKTALSFFFAVHLISKHTNLPATLVLYWAYTPQKFNLGNPKWVNRNHPACTDKRIQLPGSGSPEIFNKKKHGYTDILLPFMKKKQIHSSLHSQLGFHSCSHWIGPKKKILQVLPLSVFSW